MNSQPRIVSLLPSATEICCALGLREQLVGVSHECDFPANVVGLPVLTSATIDSSAPSTAIDTQVRSLVQQGLSMYSVNESELARLKPDIIVTQDTCEVCAVALSEVEQAVCRILGARVQVVSLAPLGLDDVFANVHQVAHATGREHEATRLVDTLQQRLQRLREVTTALPKRRVLHLEWTEPPMVGGHWTPQLLRDAGGIPVLAHERAPTRTQAWQAIAESDPDVVLVAPCGFDLKRTRKEMRSLAAHPIFAQLRAVRQGEVWLVDGNAFFNRPGPRLVDSAEIAAAALHPQRFNTKHITSGPCLERYS